MKRINVTNGPQNASRIILGCMRMPALGTDEAVVSSNNYPRIREARKTGTLRY